MLICGIKMVIKIYIEKIYAIKNLLNQTMK